MSFHPNTLTLLIRQGWFILSSAPDPLLIAIVLPAAVLVGLAWGRFEAFPNAGRFAFTGVLVFGLLDAALLAALPRLGLSYGRPGPALFLFTAGRIGMSLALAWVWQAGAFFQPAALSIGGTKILLWMCAALNILLSGMAVYGLYVEPFQVQTTQIELPVAPSRFQRPLERPLKRPLRILHLTDLHIEYSTRREDKILEAIRLLQPDLIALTGDYLNLDYLNDPQARQDARTFLSQLHAPFGVYAVRGSVDGGGLMDLLFHGLEIRVLDDETAAFPYEGGQVVLLGVSDQVRMTRARASLQSMAANLPPEAYSILLYHTPDLAETASQAGIDLYLAGHTHGGQVRLPFIGAMYTASVYGRRFQAGLYPLNGTSLYISRGLGMEGGGMPRLRFLCPPEIVFLSLGDS